MIEFLKRFFRPTVTPALALDPQDVTLVTANQRRWDTAHFSPTAAARASIVARRLVLAKDRYQTVASKTGVPWWVIAVIHERESSQRWDRSLAQGDPWNKVSTHVPAGRGPFTSWEAAAEDALVICPPHAAKWKDWSMGGALTLLEKYNGLSYARGPFSVLTQQKYPPMPSPYIWSGSQHYKSGKFIADHVFDINAVDQQLGCAVLIFQMGIK